MPRPTPKLLTADQVAEQLQIPKTTLYQWRSRRHGPPALRVGRYLRYQESDVHDWIDERRRRDEHR